MDDPFPRTLGNRAMHSLSLQRHLHDQMQSNSELCDVILVVNQVVSQLFGYRVYKHFKGIMYQNLQFGKFFFCHRKSELTGACL